MIAIETRYLGPTNTKGSRIIATTCNGQRLTMPYEHESDTPGAHRRVADMLAAKYGWLDDGMRLVGGATKRGYCWVLVHGDGRGTA